MSRARTHRPDSKQGPGQDPSEFRAILPAPFGAIGIRGTQSQLTEIVFLPPGTAEHAARDALSLRAAQEIHRFLTDPTHAINLPLPPTGTVFQRRVWAAISAIPPGTVRTYGDLARALSSAPRAIGQACGANPYPLAVPCHRVVGAGGLGGFAHARGGFLMDAKRWLLRHEETP